MLCMCQLLKSLHCCWLIFNFWLVLQHSSSEDEELNLILLHISPSLPLTCTHLQSPILSLILFKSKCNVNVTIKILITSNTHMITQFNGKVRISTQAFHLTLLTAKPQGYFAFISFLLYTSFFSLVFKTVPFYVLTLFYYVSIFLSLIYLKICQKN